MNKRNIITILIILSSTLSGCIEQPDPPDINGPATFTFALQLIPSDLNVTFYIIVPGLNYTWFVENTPDNLLDNLSIEGDGSYQLISTQYGSGINISAKGPIDLNKVEDVRHQGLMDMYEKYDYYHVYLSNSTLNFTVYLDEKITFENTWQERSYIVSGNVTPGWQLMRGYMGGWTV